MKKTVALLITLFILSGCISKTPPMREYRINSQKSETTYDNNACKEKNIKIALSFSDSSLVTQTMKYTKDDFVEYSFSESQWARSPNRIITQEILQSVRETDLFRSVQNYKSRSASEYILESNIEEFIQHFNAKEKSSYVSAKLSFTLIDSKTSRTIESLTLSKKVVTKRLDASGGVQALSLALSQILQEKSFWLNELCR